MTSDGETDYPAAKKRVAYFYDADFGSFWYGDSHPMKPQRVRMTHELIASYGLYEHMDTYAPTQANARSMTKFHGSAYVDFLQVANQAVVKENRMSAAYFGIGDSQNDCPVFDGMFEMNKILTGTP